MLAPSPNEKTTLILYFSLKIVEYDRFMSVTRLIAVKQNTFFDIEVPFT
jgi:hypothetical protein